ncbi:hypothetical protein GCM10010406_54970 [Streptomyces thermolineatus]|uniref:Uncharacterized protein n=1 Tax=Streptomyces thermolineatus TaxID=44033 RepID=A0ABP6ADW8_9ACTN
MKTSFKVHAALAVVVSALSLLTSALTLLPGQPVPYGGGLLPAVNFGLAFLLLIAMIVRWCALETTGVRLSSSVQWPALYSLPRITRIVLACLFVTGIALTAGSMIAGTSQQAGKAENGRYYAIDINSSRRERVEVSKSEFDGLVKKDRRAMHAISGMLAAGAATMTLIIGQLHPSTGWYLPPPQLDVLVRDRRSG